MEKGSPKELMDGIKYEGIRRKFYFQEFSRVFIEFTDKLLGFN